MSIISMTTELASQISLMSWGQRRFDVTSRSVFGAQAIETGHPLWTAEVTVAPRLERQAGPWKALLLNLEGQINQLELWDIQRPVPLGTMRGTMVLGEDAAAGAKTIQISAGSGQAGKTLLMGDMLQLGSGVTQQVVMATADAIADVNGDIEVSFNGPLRNAFSAASAVTWDKPKALFRRTVSESRWDYEPKFARGFGMSLIEDWRP